MPRSLGAAYFDTPIQTALNNSELFLKGALIGEQLKRSRVRIHTTQGKLGHLQEEASKKETLTPSAHHWK